MERELRIPLDIKEAMEQVMELCKKEKIPLGEVFQWAKLREGKEFEQRAGEFIDLFNNSCVSTSVYKKICVDALCLFKEKEYVQEREFLNDLRRRVGIRYRGYPDTSELQKALCELIYTVEIGQQAYKPSNFRCDWNRVKRFLKNKVEEL